MGRRRLAAGLVTLALALVCVCALVGNATAAPRPVLAPGSHGKQAAALQWLLGGNKPSVFRGISTFGHEPNGYYGPRTKQAVYRMKYRLGWPNWSLRSSGYTAGPLFQAILRGEQARPVAWIAIAAARVSAPKPVTDVCDLRVRQEALRLLATGVHEIPDGSNRDGPILSAIQATTGAVGLAWCVSAGQYITMLAGIGILADHTAGVFYYVGYARSHGWLNARPKVGAGVAFLDGQGHWGTVVAVTAHGIVSVEGNHSNRIAEVYHAIGSRPMVFVYYPHPPGGCR